MVRRIAGELIEREIEAREGTVYITQRYVYKVFGKRKNPYDEWEIYNIARTEGVPVPDAAKFTAQLTDGALCQTVGGLRFTRAFGRFFQLSKPGGEKTLINEIRRATNRVLLGSIIMGLEKAQELGVTDPQGFINVNGSPPLTFIDVHFRGRPNLEFKLILEAAIGRLGELN